MLLLSFQPFTLGGIELAVFFLSIALALAYRIMPRGSTSTHSRHSDMVKRRTGAAEASGKPPYEPTQKSAKRESSNSANLRNPLQIPPQTEKPSQPSNGHRGESSNGHRGESSNGHRGESSNGHRGESSNGHRGESSNGHRGESSNGHRGESSNGHRGESSNGHRGESSNGHKAESSNGNKGASSNGHKTESSDGLRFVSNGYEAASNGHKGKSSGCSDGELSGSSSESGLTVDSLIRLKHDTAPTSSKSSNVDSRIGPLEKKCEKLILNDEVTPPSSEVLPPECIHLILGQLKWRHAEQLRGKLGKIYREFTSHPAFVQSRPKAEGEFSPISFMVDAKDDLLWYGFNTKSREWESLPSLSFAKDTVLPSPDPDLFKDYLVAGDGGLLCFNVGKSTGRESLVVCNPLTRQAKLLPPLKYSRHPVLMHFRMVDTEGNYKIVVAGSAATGTEDVSLKTEEYDSRTGEWECPEGSDMPCQPFGLNEYQNGVQIGDLLLCGVIIDTRGRGILIYDLKKKTWLQDHRKLHIPLVRTPESNIGHLATSQLVECGGSVYVFSEQECGREVFFMIHKLNLDGLESNPWEEISRRKRVGGRGLLVYPEFTCIAISGHELVIFNTVEQTMEIIDLNNVTSEVASLRPVPSSKGNRFHSLNPIGFPYRPSYSSLVCPRGRHPKSRCKFDLKQGQYCSECERRNSDSGLIERQPVPVDPAPAVAQNIAPVLQPVSHGDKMVKSFAHSRRNRKKNTKRNGSGSLSVPLRCRP